MTMHFSALAPGARLADRVADALAGEIRNGRVVAGAKLPPEAALSAQFSVSRTVVREAISRLKSIGLVDSRQGSGVYVREAGIPSLSFDASYAGSREAVIQMVEVRRALESEVAGLAAERRTAADVRQLRRALTALDRAVRAGGDGVMEDVAFHRAIGDAAHNPFLQSTLQYLSRLLQGATRVTRANEARRQDFARQVREEHDRIVEAIAAGDAQAARSMAAAHMNNAIRRIEEADPAFWQQEGTVLARALISGLSTTPPAAG
ncbi:FadR/GntR family transcriptional regulator [Variovorax sp.]|uniref:FadR/GntR family transcriptional regulator n=1 Tax=Variovorax sp. TaxID=1871043 RepID=UPI002D5B604E|nr:FadR/GntR family transcriptional regulator [Variovorax sp.]HYP85572.1 FadR/GntR family transcriptional regulator [Variovorax sp.]